PAPDLQRGEGHDIDPYVVVFEVCAGLVHRAVFLLCKRLTHRTVCPIRLPPKRSGPVAGLAKQIIPLDVLVMRRVKEIHMWRHIVADIVIDVMNQAALPCQADDGREKSLRYAVRDVGAFGIAPLRNDVSMTRDQTASRSTVLYRADQVEEGF